MVSSAGATMGKGLGSDSTAAGQNCSHNSKRQAVALDLAGHFRDSLAECFQALLLAPVGTGAGPRARALTDMLSPNAACKIVGQGPRCVATVLPPSTPRRWLSAPVSEDTRSIRTAVMLMFPHHSARNIMHWGSARGC